MTWLSKLLGKKEHIAVIVGVQHTKSPSGPLGTGPELPMTIVLARCVCGCDQVETKVLHGHWTQAQITGKSEADSLLNDMQLKVKE